MEVNNIARSALLVGALATSLSSFNSLASESSKNFYITPTASYYLLDDKGNIDDMPALGLNGGYQFLPHWAAEVEVRFAQGESRFEDDADLAHYQISGLYLFEEGQLWQPYLIGSIGALSFDVDKNRTETVAAAGGGTYLNLTDNIRLRGDGRIQYSIDDELIDTVFSIGAQFRFGFGRDKSTHAKTEADNRPAQLATIQDGDNDGVADLQDHCLDSKPNANVMADGCVPLHEETRVFRFEIHFDMESAALLPEYEENVAKLAKFMQTYPDSKVRITGYADSTGSEAFNLQLSQQRAETVTHILVKQYGIDPSHVSAIGRGEADPIASNRTEEGLAMNRRDIAIIKAHVWVR